MNTLRNSDQVAVALANIHKYYEIHHDKPTLVERYINGANEIFKAIDDISLVIKKGDRVGIIGMNGSGKTTILKIIAGITTPTSGTVKTVGKIVSLIDLQAGFHSDLTGEQNIYLNGMLLGIPKAEIEKKMNEIIAYAELRQFIDAPLFTYSSGMILRLGFAIAVHAEPDILLLDENINVGDAEFHKKCKQSFKDFFREGKTIIVVTHQLRFISEICTRIIHLHRGKLLDDGGVEVLDKYKKSY